MKLKRTKWLGLTTFALMSSIIVAGSAFAASSTSGSMGGTSVSGSVSLGVDQATGQTTCGASNCNSYVKVTYYYKFGDASITRTATKESSSFTHVSATAAATMVPAKTVSAKAEHKTNNANYTWQDVTTITP